MLTFTLRRGERLPPVARSSRVLFTHTNQISHSFTRCLTVSGRVNHGTRDVNGVVHFMCWAKRLIMTEADGQDALGLSCLDVPRLYEAGLNSQEIASAVGLGQRRVQQIVAKAGLRPAAKPIPPRRQLRRILKLEVARHGGNYGWGMLHGALVAHHPGYRLPRRRVLAALRELFPVDAAKRDAWTAQRLERGRYFAPHAHYSWHLDYACKMQEYGVYVGACLPASRCRCPQPTPLDVSRTLSRCNRGWL